MKKLLHVSLLVCAVSGLLGCTVPAAPADNSLAPLNPIGPAPEFNLAKIGGGNLKSAELKGKVVVLDVWATWCTPCIAEIPNYNLIAENHDKKDLEILGITVESGAIEKVTPFVAKFGMKYPVVMGDDALTDGLGGVNYFPMTFVVGKDWKIYKKYLGALPGKKEKIEKDIAMLLTK